jgi:hypothetical protein
MARPSKILAVAFTDLNGDGKFSPNKDALIAELVDTNHDKVVSVGDTLHFGTYPLSIDGSTTVRGTFLHADSLVTFLSGTPTSTGVVVGTADGLVGFSNGTISGQTSENFFTDSFATTESALRDFITPGQTDVIEVTPGVGGAGLPDTAQSIATLQPGDQPFLDVFIA